ncbi:hypothetical protein [Nonomuraea wenchangensis]|uniref:Uncharacterized protein n=1 Tax=Nonomuraea wenchangensis TaxID=568860 RepID=A0A1I0F250_9ACTN|nr:hypothetical protein [Nonomuraea wenchangensis]SET51882.1 hypothetical protein SAMN05421811_103289 [Nonomuraea wenchangensis]
MTDNLPTVDDFASYPNTPEEATARRLAEYMAVEAHWSASLNQTFFKAQMEAEKSGENFADAASRYLQNQALMTAEHSVSFLLRALIEHLPEKADEIAAQMWDDWEDPPLVALTWTALESFGIDPKAVQDAALKRWQTLTATQELQQTIQDAKPAETEVHPGQTSLSGGA